MNEGQGGQVGMKPLKYYANGKEVLLSHTDLFKDAKFICNAASNRLAQKIASNMNQMESRKQKEHEIYMCGQKGGE